MKQIYVYRVQYNLRDDVYDQGWTVQRVNSNGQGWEIGAYRTARAAEHAAASLRWAEVIDRQGE